MDAGIVSQYYVYPYFLKFVPRLIQQVKGKSKLVVVEKNTECIDDLITFKFMIIW